MDPQHIWDRRRGDLDNASQFETPTLIFVVVRTDPESPNEPLLAWVSSLLDPFISHWPWLRSPPTFADYTLELTSGSVSYLYGELAGECNEDEYLLLQLLLEFSSENDVAVHIWHLVYQEMIAVVCHDHFRDGEVLVNRLWLKEGEVVFVDEYTSQAPIPLHRAIDSIRTKHYSVNEKLTHEFVLQITVYGKYNLGAVYNVQLSLPQEMLTLILAKPWIIGQATQAYQDLGKIKKVDAGVTVEKGTVAIPLATICEAHIAKSAGNPNSIETILAMIIQTGLAGQTIPKLMSRRNPRETLQNILIKDHRLAYIEPENPTFIEEALASGDDEGSITDRFASLFTKDKFEDIQNDMEENLDSSSDDEPCRNGPTSQEFSSQMHRVRDALKNTEYEDFHAFLHQTFGTRYNDESDYLLENENETEIALEIVDVDDSEDAVIYRDFDEERAQMVGGR